jgi:ubiquitin-activating enzyme E1
MSSEAPVQMTDENFDANAANSVMDRYSRQIAALGVDTMRNLGGLSVLIVGQKGVGVETAKDLILQGPKQVVVWDNEIASIADLGTNFYLTDKHVGVAKRSAVAKQLAELNPYVSVSAYEGELTEDYLRGFGAVIVTLALPSAELFRINEVCRTAGVTFLWAVTQGPFAAFFADFGDTHTVTDADGEPKKDFVIQSISSDLVTVTADAHGLSDGDGVVFTDIEGPLAVLNGATGVRIKRVYTKNLAGRSVLVPSKFRIDLTRSSVADKVTLAQLDWANGGGIVSEVKPTETMEFKPLSASLLSAGSPALGGLVQHLDQGKTFSNVGGELHLALCALLRFRDANAGADPALHSSKDAAAVSAHAAALIAEAAEDSPFAAFKADADTVAKGAIVRKAALYARAELSGFCAFLGGVAAQEVLKRFGKWTPVHQWVYYDIASAFPSVPPVDARPQASRYDHQISVWGQAFQHKVLNERWFLVGCGALGCEYIKAFALMGIGAGSRGRVYITDMDRIELSNLSRQFLFRAEHVSKPKSVCAAAVAATMNPGLGRNVTCFEGKVCAETEDVFTSEFWAGLTGVWNALDNVHARRYTDAKCLLYGLPLMESGTQGTKANSEVILPYKTTSYSDIKDQETGGIAACTLRNFPNLILHCIEWAKPKFQEIFELLPAQANSLITEPAKFWETAEKQGNPKATLAFLKDALSVLSAARSYDACITLAQKLFVESHRDNILDLISALPEDARVVEPDTGADLGPFWTGAKRFPRVAHLNVGRVGEAEAAAAGHGAADKPSSPSGEGEEGSTPMGDVEGYAPSNSNPAGVPSSCATAASADVASPTNGADAEHLHFLHCASNLFAFMFGVPAVPDLATFAERVRAVPAPAAYQPPKFNTVQIDDDPARAAAAAASGEAAAEAPVDELAVLDAEIEAVSAQLKALNLAGAAPLVATEFEKDDDSNYHIDMITALSNMRAWNYKIKPATRLHVKTVAGKIIAALATTTAMITGLTSLEYYKLALGMQYAQKDQFCNTNVNLAVSVFNAFEPDDALRTAITLNIDTLSVPYPPGFTSWDSVALSVTGETTMRELLEQIPRAHYGVTPIQLFKDGLTEKDIEGGRGQPLCIIMDDVVPRMALQMLNRPGISDNMKAQFQKQVDDANAFNAAKRAKLERKVLPLYKEIYGPLVDPTVNFVVLDGVYLPPKEDEEVAAHGPAAEALVKTAEDPYGVSVRAVVPKLKVFFDPAKFDMTA